MNRMFDFKMMVKAALIVTLSLAIVFASGCRKKQPDKTAKTTPSPVSNNQKLPEHDAFSESPAVESNDQNVQNVEAGDQNAVALPDATSTETVTVPDTNTKETVAAVPRTETNVPISAPREPATIEQPSPDQLKEMTLSEPLDLNSFAEMNDTKTKVDFISKVAGKSPESLPDLVDKALEDKDPAVRSAAIEELVQKGLDTPDSISAIERAMNDPDPTIRQKGINACANITDPAVTGVFEMGLNDESEDVRADTISLAAEKDLLPILESGMTSRYSDVKEKTVAELAKFPSKDAVPILLPGLDDPDPKIHEITKDAIKSLTGQEFDTSEQGKAWVSANPGDSANDPNQN